MQEIKEVFIGFGGLYSEDLVILGIAQTENKIRECVAQAYYNKLGDGGCYYRKMPLIEFTGFDNSYYQYAGNVFTSEDENILEAILKEYPKSYFENKSESKTKRMSLGTPVASWKTLEELFREFQSKIDISEGMKQIDFMKYVALAFAKNFENTFRYRMYKACMVALECFIQGDVLNKENYVNYMYVDIVNEETPITMDKDSEFFKLMLQIYVCFDNNEISLSLDKLEKKDIVKMHIRDITESYYRDKEMGLQ